MIEECKAQETALLEELQGHSDADQAFLISCSYILELAKRASELFTRSQPDQKNRLLRFVFDNCSVKGEKLIPKLKKPFEGIVNCNKSKNWLPEQYDLKTVLFDVEYCENLQGVLQVCIY